MSNPRFLKHSVKLGDLKARVTYSAFRMNSTGAKCVTLYAKDFNSGRALAEIFAGVGFEDNTDTQADYFEKGLVRILKSSPHYPAALARANG